MFDVPSPLRGILELIGAYLLALPIGWDRERNDRSMGLRTFPLVAVASCAFLVIAQRATPDPGQWNKTLEGVATGVGFLGAGAIVKYGIHVLGTATAAGVWMTAAMGAAAAFGQWGIAIALSVIGFSTLRLIRRLAPPGLAIDRADHPACNDPGMAAESDSGAHPGIKNAFAPPKQAAPPPPGARTVEESC